MIFDKLAGMVERYLPEMIPVLNEARLFHFPEKPHESLSKSHSVEWVQFVEHHFFLPFDVVAIEDPFSCVLLWDSVRGMQGLTGKRYFLESYPFADNLRSSATARDDPNFQELLRLSDPDTVFMSWGWVNGLECETSRINIDGVVSGAMVANKGDVLISRARFRQLIGQSEMASILGNVKTAYEEVMWFNSPDRFIVEVSPVNQKVRSGVARGRRVARSQDKPLYTLITPREAMEKLGHDTVSNGHKTPAPHPRRRHYRTLNSDRYVNAKGKTVVVKATWVGPSEAVQGNKRYRVLLDR